MKKLKLTKRKSPDRRLRFTPTAWAKLRFLRDFGQTEVGGFGISAEDDLLLVEDIELVRQDCTAVSVTFHDDSVADYFDRRVDRGIRPERFARVWVHTHPGNCAQPSLTDEETFARVFGRAEWAVMFILAQGDKCSARLRFNIGPGGAIEVPVSVDYDQPFLGSDHQAWEREYRENVHPMPILPPVERGTVFDKDDDPLFGPINEDDWQDAWYEYCEEPEAPLLERSSR